MIFTTALIWLSIIGASNAVDVPEENYDFLTVLDTRCMPASGKGLSAEVKAECEKLNEPRRYRGTWYVAFETSIFKPTTTRGCIEGANLDYFPALVLEGSSLPWPGRWGCARKYDLEFIGRRGPSPNPTDYRVVVDRMISAKRLPDPPHQGDCLVE